MDFRNLCWFEYRIKISKKIKETKIKGNQKKMKIKKTELKELIREEIKKNKLNEIIQATNDNPLAPMKKSISIEIT